MAHARAMARVDAGARATARARDAGRRRATTARASARDGGVKVERRGRPRKEIARGDAEGVRKLLAQVVTRFPEVEARGGEGATPVRRDRATTRRDDDDAATRDAAAKDEDGRTMARAEDDALRRASMAASKVGERRSVESRKKIAAAQRERWRAARAAAGAAATASLAEIADSSAVENVGTAQQRQQAAEKERTAKLTKLIAMKKSTTRAEKIASSTVKVNQFSYELGAYTKLRDELASWSDGFERVNGRRPNFKDVQKTRIPWLIESFQEYVRLRNKLISETPNIRGEVGKLAKATLPTPRSVPKGELRLSIDDDVGATPRHGDDDGDSNWSVFNFTR
jgi:hypothetical protein